MCPTINKIRVVRMRSLLCSVAQVNMYEKYTNRLSLPSCYIKKTWQRQVLYELEMIVMREGNNTSGW